MAKSNAVIIKRVKKGGEAGGHGGAWKVAYADFVTAMMAFFLLLWLLNATTNAQKRGIADYFAPTVASKSTTSGSGGVLGGQSPTEPGSQVSSSAPAGITTSFTPPQDFQPSDDDTSPGQSPNDTDQDSNSSGNPNSSQASSSPTTQAGAAAQSTAAASTAGQTPPSSANPFLPFNANNSPTQTNPYAAPPSPTPDTQVNTDVNQAPDTKPQQGPTPNDKTNPAVDQGKMTDKEFQKLKAESEEKQFAKAQYDLQQAIQQIPDLKSLAKNLLIDRTEEGLRIQIVDQEKTAMFPTGSTSMSDQAQRLMTLVSEAISKLPNKISITGHADSTPYSGKTDYSNWELSTDRANAARRALVSQGFPEDRIATVVGKADTENLIADNPLDPRNRRISIVVLRENKLPATSGPAGPDDGASAVAPPAASAP